MWTQASAVRQVYWLWQILELWTPLEELGVASSLLVPDNLRVEGWRLRLRELYTDAVKAKEPAFATASTGSGASSSDSLEAETSSGASTPAHQTPHESQSPTTR
jgi:protein phosphatase